MASSPWTPAELLARWEELEADETVMFPVQLMAEEFGYEDVGRLQTRLTRLGVKLPRLSSKAYERDHAIGEIKFMREAGFGIGEIAQKVGRTADQLVADVHRWHGEGLVDFDWATDRTWTLEDEPWKSSEFALGPKARNGAHGRRIFKTYANVDGVNYRSPGAFAG